MFHENPSLRRGLILEYLTLTWNMVGTVVVIVAAMTSHSVALLGFGLDSIVEIGASIIVIWQLCGIHDQREQKALRLIGLSFFALAIYILGQSVYAFYFHLHPSSSRMGILWLALSVVVMLTLAAGKLSAGRALNNQILKSEAKVTLVDAYLAGSTLLGLVLNTHLGWWWADPLAGLLIVFYGFREGAHAWNEASRLVNRNPLE